MQRIKEYTTYLISFLIICITIYSFFINPDKNPDYLLQYDGFFALLFPILFICTIFIFCLIFCKSIYKDFISEVIIFSSIIFISFNFVTVYNGSIAETAERLFLQIINSHFTGIQFVVISSAYSIILLYLKKYARLLTTGIALAISFIDYGKRCFFNDHLYINDFYLINKDFLEVIIPFTKEYADFTLIFLIILFTIFCFKNSLPSPYPPKRITSLTVIVIFIITTCLNYIFIFDKKEKNFFVVGYSWYYNETGFLTGFLNNVLFSIKTTRLYATNEDIKSAKEYLLSLQQEPYQGVRPNIIIWQEESYDDLRKYPSFNIPQAVYTKYDTITHESIYGYALNPQYYTINSQFEFMSGLFYKYFYPEMAIYTQNRYPLKFSIGYALQKNGYSTGSLHKYFPSTFNSMAKNGESLWGVTDSFKLKNSSQRYENSPYISSLNYAHEALSIIKNYYLPNKVPFALFVQTDQNHTPHALSNLNSQPNKAFINGKYDEGLSVYAHGIQSSNDAIFFLISELKKLNEPFVFLFYGDHNTHAGNKDSKSTLLDKNTTTFFIWSNYKKEHKLLMTLSHAYLGTELFKYIGLPMNRYQLFMNQMQKYCRGMNSNISIDHKGDELKVDDNNFFIKMHKAIQFDVTSGKNLLSETLSEIPH